MQPLHPETKLRILGHVTRVIISSSDFTIPSFYSLLFELYSFMVRNNCGGGKILCGNRLRGDAFFDNKKEMSNDLKIFREFLEKGDEKKKVARSYSGSKHN